MIYFTHILLANVIPLSIMIGFGIVLQRTFHLDIKTMSKLLFYLFSPVLVFMKLYESNITGSTLAHVLLFFALFFATLHLAVEIADPGFGSMSKSNPAEFPKAHSMTMSHTKQPGGKEFVRKGPRPIRQEVLPQCVGVRTLRHLFLPLPTAASMEGQRTQNQGASSKFSPSRQGSRLPPPSGGDLKPPQGAPRTGNES